MKIGVIGLGTVGYGVVEILTNEKERLEKRIGQPVEVIYGCGLDEVELPKGVTFTKDFDDVINDPTVDVVVELIGGMSVAKKIMIEAMNTGKHVVTANKALIAHDGKELFEVARKNDVHLFYEASVGGGIPVLCSQKESLIANNIQEISGILNGTTNFILTLMEKENLDFQAALDIATKLGYVEANPALDLDGIDAAHKISILAMNGFETFVDFDSIRPTGIQEVTKTDIDFASKLGYRIKLIAQAKKIGDCIGVDVDATLVSYDSLLSNVMDSYNVVEICNDYVDNIIYYGRGAGRYVTASAVVSDILKTVQAIRWDHDYQEEYNVVPITKSKYYVRSNQVQSIEYTDYLNQDQEHVYLTPEIEREDLLKQVTGNVTIFKVK